MLPIEPPLLVIGQFSNNKKQKHNTIYFDMTNNTTCPLVRKRSSKYLLMFFLSFERLKYVKITKHAFIGIQNYKKIDRQ